METSFWLGLLDERQQKEVEFAKLYTSTFRHGTDGHNRLYLIAAMADLLDGCEASEAQLTKLLENKND